ncbi:MAG: DUF3109 family protein [Bacteroidales bacterium]|jgi:hypothetical protein|nr:DUF3109 family protein [Bacteroidales bacterium]
MIAIENTLISDDIFTEYFCCNLDVCKGCCCVEGDAGAPLDENEIHYLEEHINLIKPYLTEKGREVIENIGIFEIAVDNTAVTPLVDRGECAFITFDDTGIAKCAIEKAFEDGKISYQKPMSCHLYPIRISKVGDADALNYDRWTICNEARIEGREKATKIFQFLKKPLIRKYGTNWYEQVVFAENELFAKKGS